MLTTVTADLPGRVRLDGVDWNARCATPGDILTPGQRCRVTELQMCIRDRLNTAFFSLPQPCAFRPDL